MAIWAVLGQLEQLYSLSILDTLEELSRKLWIPSICRYGELVPETFSKYDKKFIGCICDLTSKIAHLILPWWEVNVRLILVGSLLAEAWGIYSLGMASGLQHSLLPGTALILIVRILEVLVAHSSQNLAKRLELSSWSNLPGPYKATQSHLPTTTQCMDTKFNFSSFHAVFSWTCKNFETFEVRLFSSIEVPERRSARRP